MISSPAPGSGKTIFTAGLLRVCSRRGLKVQPYKCGPDSMDAQLLALAGNRDCINLDTWLASRTHTQQIYNEYGEYADVCITEGKGGLFDGHDGIKGSSAELAALMQIPVILIVNARTMGYSAAAVLHGFKNLYDKIRIAGVVFNHVSAPAHMNCLKKACEKITLQYPRQCAAVKDCLAQLSRIEKAGRADADEAAHWFGVLMGELFWLQEDEYAEDLRRLGYFLGKFIYLQDASVDLYRDLKKERYNPLAFLEIADHRPLLRMLIGEATEVLERLPLKRDERLIKNILYAGVWVRYEQEQAEQAKRKERCRK